MVNGDSRMGKCLIIGGHSGIGKAVAEKIDGPSCPVVVPSREEMDVSYRFMVERYILANGPFSHVVYSAGYNELSWIRDMKGWAGTVYDRTFYVNVFGFMEVVSSIARGWPEEKVSAVAVSSDAAERPMRGSLAYCASKAALNMTVKCMARELAPLWRVNAVAPGMVEGTAMTEYIDKTIPEFRGWSPNYARRYEESSVPTGRRATLEEVAETISWVLFGPDQMTGSIITVNGGRS